MTEKQSDAEINRRKFLKGAAVTAVATTAAGAGVALLNKPSTPPPSAGPPLSAVIARDDADLAAQLAALQAENTRLQADLDLAVYRLEAAQTTAVTTDTAVQTLTAELDTANQQIGVLAGLLALYEQLDEADITTLLTESLETVTAAIADAADDLPSLSESIAWGRQALTELDDHIPLLENGRSWLGDQTDKMQRYYTAVEALLETVVEQVGPFLEMFTEWVQKILKWLPFNLGERTSTIMDALTTLLLATPETLAGLFTNIAEPIDVLVGLPDEEAPLRRNLIRPMQDQTLKQADTVVAKTTEIKTIYEEKMVRQVGTAVVNRQQIKNLIQTYRQQHQI